jgi:hypothetical protein
MFVQLLFVDLQVQWTEEASLFKTKDANNIAPTVYGG